MVPSTLAAAWSWTQTPRLRFTPAVICGAALPSCEASELVETMFWLTETRSWLTLGVIPPTVTDPVTVATDMVVEGIVTTPVSVTVPVPPAVPRGVTMLLTVLAKGVVSGMTMAVGLTEAPSV